jgi:hypothetical protein
MACNSGDANTVFKNIPSILRSPEKIPDLLLLVVVGKDDLFAKETTGRAIFEKSIGLTKENKNLIRLRSDRSGQPPLSADHFSPLALNQSYDSGKSLRSGDRERRSPGSMARDATDTLDYFGYWKWFDALTDAAFFGRNRNIALGDTPEQRFHGKMERRHADRGAGRGIGKVVAATASRGWR